MAPSSSSLSSSSKSSLSPPPLPPHHPPHFTPIQECEREENDDDDEEEEEELERRTKREVETESKHHPTPLHHHHSENRTKQTARRRPESDAGVSCNECLPSNRDKFSVVPLDNSGVSPNGRFKSILFSLTKKSPRTTTSSASSDAASPAVEHWKIALAELSHKLIHATKKRDDAVLEASRLKHSVAELEKKLDKLEAYCHDLKSGLEVCSNHNQAPRLSTNSHTSPNNKLIEHFLVCVAESRSSVRLLSRSLTLQLRHAGPKIHDRLSLLLQPYEIKLSLSKNPRAITFYLEALLNRAFFDDFESIGFCKSSVSQILNPVARSESNFASFCRLRGLTWEEVLSKGTRHFSEEFSRFCDRKMSEVVAMLGWNRAWPEPLLQAFFGASKGVWLVHLLANSVHPGLPVFRADKGIGFDPVYMEDMGGDRARGLVPGVVRIMVTPGFYVYGSVVKCKVLCRYQNNNGNNINGGGEKG